MSYYYRSLCVDALAGTVTPVSLSGPVIGDCRKLEIRGHQTVYLDRAGIALRAGVRGGRFVCAWRDTLQQDADGRGACYLYSVDVATVPINLGPMFGSWTAFGPDGLLYVPRDTRGGYTVHDLDGTQIGGRQQGPVDATGFASSTGLWYVDEEGIVYAQFIAPWYADFGGVTVYHPMVKDTIVAGQVDQEPAMPPRPYLDIEGWRRMWNVPVDHAIEFAELGMTRYVAISGENTPEPDDFSGWVPYAPYVIPTPEPDPLPAIDIKPQRKIWRGSLNGVVRGNIGNEPDAVNLIEDAREWDLGKPRRLEDEKRLQSVFLDSKGDLEKTMKMASRNRVPVVLDPDGDYATADAMRARLQAESIRVIDARQQYPARGQSAEDYERMVEANLTACVIRPLYTRGGLLTERQVADCNIALDRIIARHPEVIMDLGFGLDRPPMSAWCADYFGALCAATPWPTDPLRQPEPPPQPLRWSVRLALALRALGAIFGKRNR